MAAGRPTIHHAKMPDIKKLFGLGKSVREIAEETGVPKTTVHRMIERFKYGK